MMREALIGNYRTHSNGLWTLNECRFSDPQYIQNIVFVHGRIAPLDLSGALSDDDEPTYDTRELSMTLESSEGTREERTQRINFLKNTFDGRRVNVVVPDFPDYYITGRMAVYELFNLPAHSSVQLVMICDPWMYSATEKVVSASAGSSVTLTNTGRMKVVPLVKVNGEIQLTFGGSSWSGSTGTFQLPALRLGSDSVEVSVAGSGSVEFTWREGIL